MLTASAASPSAVLLDTHIFLWWVTADSRLSPTARSFIVSPSVRVLVSVVSVWEIAIKATTGKLTLPEPVATFIPTRLAATGFETLVVTVPHALETAQLPLHHRDPFDRILIAQSRVENIPLVSADTAFDAYSVTILR